MDRCHCANKYEIPMKKRLMEGRLTSELTKMRKYRTLKIKYWIFGNVSGNRNNDV